MSAIEESLNNAEKQAFPYCEAELMAEALRGVAEIHAPINVEPSATVCRHCARDDGWPATYSTDQEWPCDTIQAIWDALGVDEEATS